MGESHESNGTLRNWLGLVADIASLAGDVLRSAAALAGDIGNTALKRFLGNPPRPTHPGRRPSSAADLPSQPLRAVKAPILPIARTRADGAPSGAAPRAAREQAPPLPAEDRLVVLARAAGSAFVYWTLSPSTEQVLVRAIAETSATALALRVVSSTHGEPAEARLLTIASGVQHAYLDLPPTATRVCVTLGYRNESGFVGAGPKRQVSLPARPDHAVAPREVRRWIDRRTGTEAAAPAPPPSRTASAALAIERQLALAVIEPSSAASWPAGRASS